MNPTTPTNPLDQLRDIYIPEPVSALPSPTAPGWPLLTMLVVAALIWAIMALLQRRQRNTYRRQAQAELQQAFDQQSAYDFSKTTANILRRSVKAAYPSIHASALTGEQWINFLQYSSGLTIDKATSSVLTKGIYQPEDKQTSIDSKTVYTFASAWIKQHKRVLPEVKTHTTTTPKQGDAHA